MRGQRDRKRDRDRERMKKEIDFLGETERYRVKEK